MAARGSDGWAALVSAVDAQAVHVGSDLAGIWGGLVRGRLEWIMARSATHMLKLNLKKALVDGGGAEGDDMDAKMVWVYSLGSVLNKCKEHAVVWARKATVTQPQQPLFGFNPEKWDARLKEWQLLDEAVGQAAEAAGTTLEAEWDLIGKAVGGSADATAAATTAAATPSPSPSPTNTTNSPQEDADTAATTAALAAISVDPAAAVTEKEEKEEEVD